MKRVEEFIRQQDMIARGERVIAGISGGADSVCLFCVLMELREKLGFDLVAVHVNHGLRGEAADRDEEFVRQLCSTHHVPLEVFRINMESIAKIWKQSLEEAGRTARRNAFESVCEQYGGSKIALAHHQNDNAETLLWNLSRGAGLEGMCGIRPVNGKYIRPLLSVSRSEIERYLAERNQPYCTDETNAQIDYTRNKLRHLVLPVLEEQVNTQAVRHMNETMEQMQELQSYMELQTDEAYACCVNISCQGQLIISWEMFRQFPDILKKMLIRRCMEEICGKKKDISQVHIRAVLELFGKQTGRSVDLPYGMQAKRIYEGVRLQTCRKILPEARQGTPDGHAAAQAANTVERAGNTEYTGRFSPVPLAVPGETVLEGRNLTIRCKIFEKSEGFSANDIPQKVYTKWFDYDIIKNSLYIRTRQDEDSIVIDKAGHRQKIKKWFINKKIPTESRNQILLIAEGSQVLWIPGYRRSSACQVQDTTKRILQIEMQIYKSDGGKKNGRDNPGISV